MYSTMTKLSLAVAALSAVSVAGSSSTSPSSSNMDKSSLPVDERKTSMLLEYDEYDNAVSFLENNFVSSATCYTEQGNNSSAYDDEDMQQGNFSSTSDEARADGFDIPTRIKFDPYQAVQFLIAALGIRAFLYKVIIAVAAVMRFLIGIWTGTATAGPNSSRDEKSPFSESAIRWENLSVSVSNKKTWFGSKYNGTGANATFLLHPSTFSVGKGELCGILGPSGAGKSTLLAALSGTIVQGQGLELRGSVWADETFRTTDNKTSTTVQSYLDIANGDIAFLHQEDEFFAMSTVRESLMLAAYLQMPELNEDTRSQIVDETLNSLGLMSVAHRRIGGCLLDSAKGLSGGERRRLSLALELISSPKAFFGDEPTTGLCSSQAQKVIGLIAKLAEERNIPAVCSIHQPRSSIWRALDSFILLGNHGKICYMGRREDAITYFKKLGYACPHDENPAEFFIDLVTVDTESEGGGLADIKRVEALAAAFEEEAKSRQFPNNGDETSTSSTTSPPSSNYAITPFKSNRMLCFGRFFALLNRSWRQNIRHYNAHILCLLGSVGQAILFSELFNLVREEKSVARSLSDRCGMLSFGVINMAMLCIIRTLELFSREKTAVTRERMRNQYSAGEYLFAKAMVELPLGAFFATAFAVVLKHRTGLRASLSVLSGSFSLLSIACAAFGFAVSSIAPDVQTSLAVGVPITVANCALGIINPSGVDLSDPPHKIIIFLKQWSSIKWAIEALFLAEFTDMQFYPYSLFSNLSVPIKEAIRGMLADMPQIGLKISVQNGNDVLRKLGLAGRSFKGCIESLVLLSCIGFLISWWGLTRCGPKFLRTNAKRK